MTQAAAILLGLEWAEAVTLADEQEDEGNKAADRHRAKADKLWKQLQAAGQPSPVQLLAERRRVNSPR